MQTAVSKLKDKLALIFLAIGMLANAACSTPSVPEEDVERKYESTMNSYQNCIYRTYPTDKGQACDTVLGQSANSFASYSGGVPTNGDEYYYYYKAYAEYVGTLDDASRAELKAKWDAINPDADSL